MRTLVYGSDQNYLPLVCFSILSIFESNHVYPDVWILTSGVSSQERSVAEHFLEFYPGNVFFRPMDEEDYLSGRTDSHITRAAYLRLCLDQILPTEYHRVLYLDADTRVVGDLEPLLELDLQGDTVAAAHDIFAILDVSFAEVRRDCKLEDGQSYFNSGVMLIDLDKWRDGQIGQRAADFSVRYPEKCRYFDQCALNAVLKGEWYPLDVRWNYFAYIKDEGASFGPIHLHGFRPMIYHFVGGDKKPWQELTYPSLEEHQRWYEEIARNSPWPNFVSPLSRANRLKIRKKMISRQGRYYIRRQLEKFAPSLLSTRAQSGLEKQRMLQEFLASNEATPILNYRKSA